MKPITFCVEYFDASDPIRKEEIQGALRHNLALDVLQQVVIFSDVEIPDFARIDKVSVRKLGKRFVYADFLKCARDPGRVYLLANADIQFEKGAGLLQFVPKNQLWALTRWERDGGLSKGGRQSQDAWALRGGEWEDGLMGHCDIQLGWPGCENSFAGRIHEAGFGVKNYCHDIHCVHRHSSIVRSYGEKNRIPRPYCLPDPGRIPVWIRFMAFLRTFYQTE
jgi:hypothetical protein